MSSYQEKLAAIQGKKKELEQRENKLAMERHAILEEMEALNNERLIETCGLTENEINSLRRAITIVGKALESDDVIFGSVQLVDEEPEQTSGGYHGNIQNKYSIHMECSFVEDCAVGLSYRVIIKTKSEGVRAIVRSMIHSDEYRGEEEEDIPRNSWVADWDYHYKITVKHPLSSEQYYKNKKN